MTASEALAADYSATASAYANLWGPVILPMALPVLDALSLSSARSILDVGAGVGGLFPHLTDRAPLARIFGIDRAEGMLRYARATYDYPVAVTDGQSLAVRDQVADVAVLAFVLFHFPEPASALAELRRTLRPGAQVGTVTWAHDPGIPGNDIWNEELDRSGAAPDPRDASVRQHELVDTPEKMHALLDGAGFANVQTWSTTFERRWDHESLLALQQACGLAGRRLALVPRKARAACVLAATARIAEIPADELVWRPEVLYTTGTAR